MDVQQNLELFRELMLCDGDIYSWDYDAAGKLIFSNCPDQAVFASAFEVFGCLSKMLDAAQRDAPAFISSDTGLIWGAAFEKVEGVLFRCHIIGPVFYSNVSADQIYHGMLSKDFSNFSAAWLYSFWQALYRVPTCQYTIFSRDLKMLHYCVTGQRCDISDVFIENAVIVPEDKHRVNADRHRVYKAERAMLQMVRLGDLNYKDALNASMMISDGVKIRTQDPIQYGRVSMVVFCSIVCRAAIEGGMSPDAAYSLGDAYIQSTLDAHTIDELGVIGASMYDDFVRRVHRIRENPRYSEPIQQCCNYIEMHIDRNLRARDLADLVGYSVTYFTRRFREETGFGISEYVKLAKIERAKLLLDTTGDTIQDISDKLGFTTRNYFTLCFREVTGKTPVEYRNKK